MSLIARFAAYAADFEGREAIVAYFAEMLQIVDAYLRRHGPKLGIVIE